MPRDSRSKSAKAKKAQEPKPARVRASKPRSAANRPVAADAGAEPAHDPVSAYEAEQIRQVAAWKAEHPHLRSGLIGRVAQSITRFAERCIPAHVAQHAIEKVYDEAERTAHKDDIERHAGVADIAELKGHRLEECDQLAVGVVAWAEGLAVAGGAATGAGGFLTSALDVPLLLTLALRTIMRVGHCYGYALDHPKDRRAVLGILMVAATDDPAKKQKLLAKLREVEDWLLEQAEEDLIEDEALELLLQIEIFDDIPGLGAITAGLGNYVFIHHASNASKRVFQEWWLRDGGKVEHIAPAAFEARPGYGPQASGVVSWAVYGSFYYLGFGASLPFWVVANRLKKADNALTRGARDGAVAAIAGVDSTIARLRDVGSPSAEQPAVAGALTLA